MGAFIVISIAVLVAYCLISLIIYFSDYTFTKPSIKKYDWIGHRYFDIIDVLLGIGGWKLREIKYSKKLKEEENERNKEQELQKQKYNIVSTVKKLFNDDMVNKIDYIFNCKIDKNYQDLISKMQRLQNSCFNIFSEIVKNELTSDFRIELTQTINYTYNCIQKLQKEGVHRNTLVKTTNYNMTKTSIDNKLKQLSNIIENENEYVDKYCK